MGISKGKISAAGENFWVYFQKNKRPPKFGFSKTQINKRPPLDQAISLGEARIPTAQGQIIKKIGIFSLAPRGVS